MDGDAELMARAVELGERGHRSAPPNPWVGCVLVRGGEVVGEGFHVRPGTAHAEVEALRLAGDRARGATAYVTLEPCAHHGRTAPCAEALIDAGISRVVVALEDPDERVRGRGLARLHDAGLDVFVGTGATSATRSLAPYLHHRRTGRAFCLAKLAMTLDAKIAAADGAPTWITGAAARHDAHELRADSQAIVIGSGTALADHPALTVRGVPDAPAPPLCVLLDRRGRVPPDGPLFDATLGPILVLTGEDTPSRVVDAWHAAGAKVDVVAAASDGSGLDLERVLAVLGSEGVLQAMVEGGARVHGSLHASALVDRLVLYVAPLFLGAAGLDAFAWPTTTTFEAVPHFQVERITPVGEDVRVELVPMREAA